MLVAEEAVEIWVLSRQGQGIRKLARIRFKEKGKYGERCHRR